MVKFSEMGLKKEIVSALSDEGLTEAFPIQETAMPHILHGEDLIGQAHTGSGKTLAFSLPIINNIDPAIKGLTALVLVPTRELALQVTGEIKKAAKHSGVKAIPIYGGVSISMQYSTLQWGQQIVVATPGRLMDLMERNAISLSKVKFLVLDEADRMLDMGFIHDIEFIIRHIPKNRQTLLFSATMPKDIVNLSGKYMKHPVKILLDEDDLSVELVDQTYLVVEERRKFYHLTEILKAIKGKVLIFCSTKHRTRILARELYSHGFRTVTIHGDLSQNQREDAMQRFREGRSQILVATDVAARGIDIPKIEQIINYDVPMDPLVYFHRIGRTARAGESGKALTLVSQHQYDDFQNILKHTKVFIKQLNEKMGIKVEHVASEHHVRKFPAGSGDRRFGSHSGSGNRWRSKRFRGSR